MALPVNYPINEMVVQAAMADISTAGSAYTVAPRRGTIARVYSVIDTAITVADATWTMKINGTAVTGVSVTVAFTSAAAGDIDSAITSIPVNEGDLIEFVSDGGSTTTSVTHFFAVIREQ